MPGKLVVVVVLMAIGIALNLLSGSLLSAGINIALLVGVLVGNDGVRTFLRGLAVLQIIWAIVILAGVGAHVGKTVLVIAAVIGIASPAYLLWALGQNDVREWMFRKNFKLDDLDQPPSV